jgi:hypothetical protein
MNRSKCEALEAPSRLHTHRRPSGCWEPCMQAQAAAPTEPEEVAPAV